MSVFAARLAWCLLLLRVTALPIWAAPMLHLSSAGGPAGSKINLLLTLSGAGDIAGIRTQINFDPQVLSFDQASRGQLGSLFDLSSDVADGCLYLTFARSDQLTSGQGILASLSFMINPGAQSGLLTELATAQVVAVNQGGAKLALAATPPGMSGASVVVTNRAFAEFVDSDHDGLRDDWEDAHRLPIDVQNTSEDPDHDGRVNILEFALGSDPLVADSEPCLVVQPVRIADADYLSLSYSRNKAASNCDFLVECSDDLTTWTPLPEAKIVVQSVDMGQTERVVIREIQPVRVLPAHFFRLKVVFN